MKFNLAFIITFLVFTANLFAQNNYFIQAGSNYFIPTGTLSERFKPTVSGSFGFGKVTSDKWAWVAKAEYFKFTKVNTEKLSVKRKITINNVESEFTVPIPKLVMDLEIGGLSLNGNYKVLDFGFFNTQLNLGFGIYNWRSLRGSYFDSLFVSDENNNTIFVEKLDVPEMTQTDWSGGFNFGLMAEVNLYRSLWFNAGANYKLVIGELWAALKLDLEM